MKKLAIVLAIILIFTSQTAFAHGGGLDKNGGHWNRKDGTYHYHR